MKILMLFPYAPLPPPLNLAGTKRNLPFFLELAKYNEMTVLSFGSSEEKKIFSKAYGSHCSAIHFIPKRSRILNGLLTNYLLLTGRSPFRQLYKKEMKNKIEELANANEFDLIHCCVQFFGYYDFPKGIPVTSDTHEVKYSLIKRTAEKTKNIFSRAILKRTYTTTRKEELEQCCKFDRLIATTEVDRSLFHQDIPDQSIVAIQNGAGEEFFEKLDIEEEPYSMVFTGLYTHIPNSDGILWFIDQIMPLILIKQPKAKIYVVGKNPTGEMLKRQSDNIVVTGFVEDVRPYIAKSQLFVIPLLAGGGIRGKALEAMAMKKAIVTTSIGVEGIHLDDTSAVFADSTEDFAASVLTLFEDHSTRNELAIKARRVAESQYDWTAKGKELQAALKEVTDNS